MDFYQLEIKHYKSLYIYITGGAITVRAKFWYVIKYLVEKASILSKDFIKINMNIVGIIFGSDKQIHLQIEFSIFSAQYSIWNCWSFSFFPKKKKEKGKKFKRDIRKVGGKYC